MSTRFTLASSYPGMLLARAARFATSLTAAWERRRIVGQLGALDDHMLRDIGITRQDVLSVLAEPLFADPSIRLAERASEARMARRSKARQSLAEEAAMTGPAPSIERRAA